MSSIIQLGDHQWQLPPAPSSQDDVLFVKESRKNQYWRRQTDFPKYFFDWDGDTILNAEHTIYNNEDELVSLDRPSSKRLVELRDREMQRRWDGVWFMNDGQLEYLTGGHYYFLQWSQLMGYFNPETNQPYGDFRYFQRDLAYHLQMVKEDPNTIGSYILKPKKTGVTQFMAADFADESTRYKGKWFGMMSKALVPDCRDTNFRMYMNIIENVPNILRPSIANQHLTMIFYGNPVSNKNATRKSRASQSGNLKWLNTRVSALPTKANAFDGGKPFRAQTDELPKYEDPYPEDVYKPTQAAMKMQLKITGKWWITSYTPENDNKAKEQAEQIYYESDFGTISNKTGRTKSELYNYFISVLDSAEGTFDRYGRTDRLKTQVYIDNYIREHASDKAAIQSFRRQNPITVDEAWRSGGAGGSVFDNIRLGFRKSEIMKDEIAGVPAYVECNLDWEDESTKERVKILPLTFDEKKQGKEGLFKMYFKKFWRQDMLNAVTEKDPDGNWVLPSQIRAVCSLDPTNYLMARNVAQGSKNALWVMGLPDMELNTFYGRPVSNCPWVEYLYRHDKPNKTLKDVMMILILFGCPIVIEGNMGSMITLLYENKFGNFIVVRDPKTKALEFYDITKHQSLVTTQRQGAGSTLQEYIKLGEEYLAPPENDEFDNLENIGSERLLKSLMALDPKDTKKEDSAMAFLPCVMLLSCFPALQKRLNESKNRYSPAALGKMVEDLLDLY
jgi:hypothetical protein